jgi:hypothetical protein
MKRRKLLTLAGLGIVVSCGVPMSQSTVLSTVLSTSQLALAEGKPMQLLTEFRILLTIIYSLFMTQESIQALTVSTPILMKNAQI